MNATVGEVWPTGALGARCKRKRTKSICPPAESANSIEAFLVSPSLAMTDQTTQGLMYSTRRKNDLSRFHRDSFTLPMSQSIHLRASGARCVRAQCGPIAPDSPRLHRWSAGNREEYCQVILRVIELELDRTPAETSYIPTFRRKLP